MAFIRYRNKNHHPVWVSEYLKGKENQYNLCSFCSHQGTCVQVDLDRAIKRGHDRLVITWECGRFKERKTNSSGNIEPNKNDVFFGFRTD